MRWRHKECTSYVCNSRKKKKQNKKNILMNDFPITYFVLHLDN